MLAEKNKWKDKRKLQAYFCYWLHQNSLKTSRSEVLIWWSDHHKWVKQKLLPNWSLLPGTVCQAITRHWQPSETAHHWSRFSPVTGVRDTAQPPSTATEHSPNFSQHLVTPAQCWPLTWCFRYHSSLSLLQPETSSTPVLPTEQKSCSVPTGQQNWNPNGLAAISPRASGQKSGMKLTLSSCLSVADGCVRFTRFENDTLKQRTFVVCLPRGRGFAAAAAGEPRAEDASWRHRDTGRALRSPGEQRAAVPTQTRAAAGRAPLPGQQRARPLSIPARRAERALPSSPGHQSLLPAPAFSEHAKRPDWATYFGRRPSTRRDFLNTQPDS